MITDFTFPDYADRASFSAYDIEHILQIPIVDVVELIAKIPRVGPGLYQGDGCRVLIKRLARGRLFADLIARQAVNALPEIRRGAEQPEGQGFELLNATSEETFRVRFSGDLRLYLEAWTPSAVVEDTDESLSS